MLEKQHPKKHVEEDAKPEDHKEKYDFYICGRMRGMPNHNVDAFNHVAHLLRQSGYRVANPAESFGGDMNRPLEDYMLHDAKLISESKALMLLPGWSFSKGATAEAAMGIWLGKEIFEWTAPLNFSQSAWHNVTPKPDVAFRALFQLWRATDGAEIDVLLWANEGLHNRCAAENKTDEKDHHHHVGKRKFINEYTDAMGRKYRTYEEPLVYVDPQTGGKKAQNDIRYDLIPVEPLLALARVYGYGAKKYEPDNWRKGYPWSLNIAALYRHIESWRAGEWLDPESGLPHLAHAAWHLFTLQWFELYGIGTDDRMISPSLKDKEGD